MGPLPNLLNSSHASYRNDGLFAYGGGTAEVIMETFAEENTACKKENVKQAVQEYYRNAKDQGDSENIFMKIVPKSSSNRTQSQHREYNIRKSQ